LDSGAEVDEDEAVEEDADDGGRSAATDALWTDVRVQPVEIALPSGVGYTLRAYRLSTELRPPDVSDREDDFPSRPAESALDEELDDRTALADMDEEELTAQALAAGRDDKADGGDDKADGGDDKAASGDDKAASGDDKAREAGREGEAGEPRSDRHHAGDETGEETGDEADEAAGSDAEVDEAEEAEEAAAGADETDDEAEEAAEPEEVPVFLSEGGKLLLFRSPEGLAEYVQSGVENELAQIDTWDEVRERIEPEDIIPLDEDRYELDLVVGNLRGGHDVWDAPLIIQAGEIARDIAYALRVPAVMTALASGSPLDDMDEGLRTVEAGGFGAFFARRKLRKIDAQTTAALGWRTIIGKISAVVDWRN
jgi:hypothetical protein